MSLKVAQRTRSLRNMLTKVGSFKGPKGPITPNDVTDFASNGNLKQVQKLLEEGFSPNTADDDGTTPLIAAARNNQIDVVRALLSCGADTDLTDGIGMTALHYASGENHGDVVRLLIERGASRNVQTTDGSTPLHLAVSQGFEPI